MDRSDRRVATDNGQLHGGDWRCLHCDGWNFARREACKKCGRQKPSDLGYIPPSSRIDASSDGRVIPVTSKTVEGARKPAIYDRATGKREGGGGGFRDFDDDEAQRRKARAIEGKRMAEERKVEKKKCEYCKRFACIC
mmetsp:Transcript_3753/g.8105  ORF Transcript_3753/g.8105 Transcript_3753/m.8105 type:complete len:138 (-) Transcript_3753:216-629(-)